MWNPLSKVTGWVKRRFKPKSEPPTPPREPSTPPSIPPRGPDRPPADDSLQGLLRAVRATGVPTEAGATVYPDSHGDDTIALLVDDVGRQNARRLLREQLESCRAYRRGSVQPGRDRWYSRTETLMSMFQDSHQVLSAYEPYFWYHVRR